jgi:galactose mutarotase-like enzyme
MGIGAHADAVASDVAAVKSPVINVGTHPLFALPHRESKTHSTAFADDLVQVVEHFLPRDDEAQRPYHMGVTGHIPLSFRVERNGLTLRLNLGEPKASAQNVLFIGLF